MSISKKKDKRRSSGKKASGEGYRLSNEAINKKPKVFFISRLRPIGNSRGVILNNQLIETAGLNADADIVIQANEGIIVIIQAKKRGVNTDLSTWDKQFKAAIKKGARPEGDLFEGMTNDFDSKEW